MNEKEQFRIISMTDIEELVKIGQALFVQNKDDEVMRNYFQGQLELLEDLRTRWRRAPAMQDCFEAAYQAGFEDGQEGNSRKEQRLAWWKEQKKL